MNSIKPTIKGTYVNSHINNLHILKGDEGVKELERRYNKPLNFRNSDNIPVGEEVLVIEHILDIISETPIPENQRDFESGRLHFRNFTTTPLGKIIFSVFRKNFKLMMMRTKYVAEHVFHGVKISSENLGENSVKVSMENNEYPIEHFRGLFYEWMDYAGYKGTIESEELAPRHYTYIMKWHE